MNGIKIGKRLRKLRGDRLALDVAKALGVAQSTLSMYESGKRIPRDSIKLKIANYYGVNVGDLFFAKDFTKSEHVQQR